MATVELIDSVKTTASLTQYITFDNIPSTYRDLTVWGQTRDGSQGSGFTYFTCRINDHSSTGRYASTNYYSYYSASTHSSYHNLGSTSDTYMKLGRMASGTSVTDWGTVGGVDVKGGIYVTFYNYADTDSYTSIMASIAGNQKAGATLFQMMGGRSTCQYMHTEEIEKIEFGMHVDSHSFTKDSQLYLYGINSA